MRVSSILGLNARSQLFLSHNSREGKRIADSKLMMYRTLKRANIPTPAVYKKFREPGDIFSFDFTTLPGSFALKPSRGFGGEGIIVVKRKVEGEAGVWLTTARKRVTIADFKIHILDILEGAYSLGNVPDAAFVQEYVGRHKAFRKYAYRGTPDVRVVVFSGIPIMAMLRLPTRDSGGRANLHQGAIGVGIDIATGITTSAIQYGEPIKYKPETKRKLNGIKIPQWGRILEIAIECQKVCGLAYVGVDIVLHPAKGPLVLELNAQPGLQIQLANRAGLKKRLERVEDLAVRDTEHGVNIAKALFGESFAGKVVPREEKKHIKASEEITIAAADGKRVRVMAKIDTGAWSSSIDRDFAKELGLLAASKILWYRKKKSSLGEEDRPVISMTFWLAGRRIKTVVSTARRHGLTYKMLIGRADLNGFIVDPQIDAAKLKEATKW